ncbi:MAG: 3-dehydroquinate synthase [Anaerolineales bacterium]|nr:3-dehydroquinate synthase [Anaerolineales bacterium]
MTNIFLYGPPGTGKSTIGKLIADHLQLPFIDLDRVIESNAGKSIPEIMETQGESAFRDLETQALQESAGHALSQVISLGGGALLREENRSFAELHGTILLLSADIATLLNRVKNKPNQRPLLAGDMEAKLSALLERRKAHYESFPLKLSVENKPAQQNALQARMILGRHHLSAMGEYDVAVGNILESASYVPRSGMLANSQEQVPAPQNRIIVTDENIARHHAETISKLNIKTVVVPAGEEHKNLETVQRLWKSFLENGLDRKSAVIALGGGVVSDMTGFAASTYMRGMDWIAVPTTLLSMVDASLGGKTGFDLPEGKNLIGSFYPPKLVVADVNFLKTLPERELISGMAEVVKHGVISDPELFELCNNGLDWVKDNLEELVKRAMAVKIKVIEDDPYEKGLRAALNLGHTVGHAVELVSKFDLRHGEAIAIGMAVEARYSARVGLASQSVVEALESTLKKLNLPTQIPAEMPRAEIIKAMRVDKKKNAKSIRFALPVEIGKVELVNVDDLESVIDDGR